MAYRSRTTGWRYDLGQRGHRAELETVLPGPDSLQFGNAGQIDQGLRALDPILEPVKAVEAARQYQRAGPVPIQHRLRVLDGRRLEQLEGGHHVSDYGHSSSLVPVPRSDLYVRAQRVVHASSVFE